MRELKCDAKAIECRTEGNKFYSNRSFHKALLKYNESLCFAEPLSEHAGHAFANRSALYLEMKLYENCLANIDLAKSNNYPEKNFEVLKKREEKCRTLMKSKSKATESFFKLSHPANKKLPFLAECLELRDDKKYGRHVVTNKNLRVGDIVAIEKPFCSVLLTKSNVYKVPDSNLYQRCANCLKDNALDLIPCPTCCEAMFCSTECLEIAFKRFHRFECPVMDRLTQSGSVHMALRILFIALSIFNDSIEDLESFVEEAGVSTIFDLDEQLELSVKEKGRLLALVSAGGRSSKTFSLTEHDEILESHPELNKMFEAHREFIRSFLHLQMQIGYHNIHGIFSGSTKKDEELDPNSVFSNLQQSIGTASMPFCSLINHSCSNNVLRVFVDGKIAVVVCHPIQKGSQLFDCYNANFIKMPKADRQAKLFLEFGFVCDCEACTKNFQTFPELNYKDAKLLSFAKKTDDEILKMPHNQAHKKFIECCDLLERNHHNFPTIELFLLKKSIATFLLIQSRPSVLFP